MIIVDWIASNVAAMIPIKIIRSYERGVEYRGGIVRREQLSPGWYWKFPWFREIEEVPVNLQWIDLPFQTLCTDDGKAVTLSCNIGYTISDAVVWLNDVQDAEQTLMNLVRPIIVEVVTSYEYELLISRTGSISRLIRAHLSPKLLSLGASLTGVGLTDFVKTSNIRLMSDAGLEIE